MAARETVEVEIEGRTLSLSNLAKVLYPQAGFTKGQVIDYYVRIAPVLLPHLEFRPLTLKRYPNGVEGAYFYEKNCPAHRPRWVETAKVPRESAANRRASLTPRESGEYIRYCVANDLATLVWAANLADLELHVPLATAAAIDNPRTVVFDLDPGAPADLVSCCRVALLARDLLSGMKLESFPKVSGSKGLQLYVPLNDRRVTYDDTKPFARAVAETLEREHPGLVVSNMKKSLRVGKVLVDWSQNDEHKTTVCVYSLRAKEQPTVSIPVTWNEIASAARKKDASGLVFPAPAALARVAKKGDLFEPVLTMKQRLPGA
jgi:bifunctional non-homologous end joining protein LigD